MMQATDLARTLRSMTPDRFVIVEGCVLWPLDDPPAAESVRKDLIQLRANYGAGTAPELLEARIRSAYEHDFNRRFIGRDLDLVDDESWTPADRVVCAEHWAAILRDSLRRHFPDHRFVVEVIGANLADIEPFEVCVTFRQPWETPRP
jgi:hypothetical protein